MSKHTRPQGSSNVFAIPRESRSLRVPTAATGAVIAGHARILTESEERTTAAAALAKKYGLMRRLYYFVRNTLRMLQRKAKVEVVYIAIDPISG